MSSQAGNRTSNAKAPGDGGFLFSIIAPVIVQQLFHDFPVTLNSFVALEIAELDMILEEIDLDPATDEGEIN